MGIRTTIGIESLTRGGHAGGTRTADEVVFANDGDMTLLGAHTIEGLNLRVDLKSKQLVPAGPAPAAAA